MTETRKKKTNIEDTAINENTVITVAKDAPVLCEGERVGTIISAEYVPTVKGKSPVELWLELAPEAKSDLTLQWYGEVFVPQYKKWLREGLLLARQ